MATFTDGHNVPDAWVEIVDAWTKCWDAHYRSNVGSISFLTPENLKDDRILRRLPPRSRGAVEIRNPDLLFVADSGAFELGGVEITTHSPDGSNIEKRYPFAWAARRVGLAAVVATPYQKARPGGQVNRLPHRAAKRNEELVRRWDVEDPESGLTQILPMASLQSAHGGLSLAISRLLWTWHDLGELFAHRLAVVADSGGQAGAQAADRLRELRDRLLELHRACMAVTRPTAASTLLIEHDRVVQTYNARPESGHWERGEGQFDSIDGRLMVTLDDLELFAPEEARKPLEFWLPQLASGHAWIAEQRARGFASKRLRNVLVTLSSLVHTKFADDLSSRDWAILRNNPRLLLERDDRWVPGIYRVAEAVAAADRRRVASVGIARVPSQVRAQILRLLSDDSLYYSSHRAYDQDWRRSLTEAAAKLPSGSRLLVPRIPGNLLDGLKSPARIVAAEGCSKEELMMLRQLHRSHLARVHAFC